MSKLPFDSTAYTGKHSKVNPDDLVMNLPFDTPSGRPPTRSAPGYSRGRLEEEIVARYDDGTEELVVRMVAPHWKRCVAKKTNNMKGLLGTRCPNFTIKGGNVCISHGGKLPVVKRRAQERLIAASDPAAIELVKMMRREDIADKDKLRAITEILDRAGVKGAETVTVEVKPWQEMLQRIQGLTQPGEAEGEEKEGEDFEIPEAGEEEWDE